MGDYFEMVRQYQCRRTDITKMNKEPRVVLIKFHPVKQTYMITVVNNYNYKYQKI